MHHTTTLVHDEQVQEDFREFRALTKRLNELCQVRGLHCDIKLNVKTTKWVVSIESIIPMESFNAECRAIDLNNTLSSAIRHMEKLG